MIKKTILMLLVLVGGVMSANAEDYTVFFNQDNSWYKLCSLTDDDNDGVYSAIVNIETAQKLGWGRCTIVLSKESELGDSWNNVMWANTTEDKSILSENAFTLSARSNDGKLFIPITENGANTYAIKLEFDSNTNAISGTRMIEFASSNDDWHTSNPVYIEETTHNSGVYAGKIELPANTEFKFVTNNSGSVGWYGKKDSNISTEGSNYKIEADGVYEIKADLSSWNWTDPELVTVPVTMTYPYATFSSKYALDFTNVKYVRAYQASMSGTKVLMTRVSGKVPANTGLFLARQEGEDSEEIPTTICTTELTGNLMKASTGKPVVSENLYSLVKRGDDYGFAKVASPYTWAEGKAYLETPAEVNAPSLGFSMDDDETTTIHSINIANNPAEEGVMYNLEGKRIDQPSKGVYIVNGKKVIIK